MISLGFAKFLMGRSTLTAHQPSCFNSADGFTVRVAVKADLLVAGWSPLEILEFVNAYLNVGESQASGRPIFDTADAAAVYSGGIAAIDENTSCGMHQASVLWNEEGSRGGAGGGLRGWYSREDILGDKDLRDCIPIGWTTF